MLVSDLTIADTMGSQYLENVANLHRLSFQHCYLVHL